MSFVVYHSLSVQERHRTPAGKLAAWICSRAAGTVLQNSVYFIFRRSWLVRIATAITIAILIGALADLSFRLLPVTGSVVASCAAVGLLVGLGAAGAGGAALGLLWGWLIGGIADAVSAELLSGPAERVGNKLAAWMVSALAGWVVGRAVDRLYHRLAEDHRRLRALLGKTGLVVALGSISLFLYRFSIWSWQMGYIGIIAKWLARHWRSIGVALTWLITVLVPVFWYASIEGDSLIRAMNSERLNPDRPAYGNPLDRFPSHLGCLATTGFIIYAAVQITEFLVGSK